MAKPLASGFETPVGEADRRAFFDLRRQVASLTPLVRQQQDQIAALTARLEALERTP